MQRVRLVLLVLAVCLVYAAPPVQAFGPYETLYNGHLTIDDTMIFDYVNNDLQCHAYTFEGVAGELLTIETHWVRGGTPINEPWVWIVAGAPPVGMGAVYTFDYDSADIMPKVMRPDNFINEWAVPASGTYTLYVQFYPYEDGSYSLRFASQSPDPAPAPDEDWMGEFEELENGDHYTVGNLGNTRTWGVHSFTVEPGDMLTIMLLVLDDIDGEPPSLVLCRGGCDPTDPQALVSARATGGVGVVNYQVPTSAVSGALYTAMVTDMSGQYGLWMRQWQPDMLLDQVAGGLMGELGQTEAGELKMNGVITNIDSYKVHSFRADPGDVVRVVVTAARDTPADELAPIAILVPGGYESGEQWLSMAIAETTVATLGPVTIPLIMPPDTLYTVVVTDASNAGQIMFGDPPVFDFGGGYEIVVTIN